MSPSESKTQADIMLALGSRSDTRIFRNTVGTGWAGEVVSQRDGLTILKNARFITYGLAPGSADLIGWHRRIITTADLGREAALFLSVEVKKPRGGVTADNQQTWKQAIEAAGGIAGIARSPADALKLIGGY